MYVFRIAVGPLVALVLAACPVLAPAAHADGASATGRSGQTLTVSRVDGLPTTGATLRVTGRGYDTGKGIYVALCADNGPGRLPSPCGGGADTSGKTGASQWISSNPPPYGKGLAVPYGPGGTFDVTIRVGAKLSASQDCTKIRCAVVTRADPPWFSLSLSIVIGVMMVAYVAVPARLIGVRQGGSRRDRLSASIVGSALGALVSTPAYLLGRIGLLMIGWPFLRFPGILIFLLGFTLQAGATSAVKAVKMGAKLGQRNAARAADAETRTPRPLD